jgi:regulatory factor X, other
MSAHHSQRPDSRASTTSVTTQQDDSLLQSLSQDSKPAHLSFQTQGPEAALLQYQASIAPAPHMIQFSQAPVQNMGQRMAMAHAQSHPHPLQMQQSAYDSSFLQQDLSQADLSQQDMAFVHMRMGSAPIPMSMDLHDEKRKKGSAVTATNDKELREMLSRNEGRPLRDVAQEVIQKERTPMAEKTKQLFAMLW